MWIRIFVLSMLLMIPVPVLAEDSPKIEVYHKDETLEFDGLTGEDNAFLAYLELTAQGGDIDDFRFVSHGLTSEDKPEIQPTRVRLFGNRTLREGQTRRFSITVDEIVEDPGTYEGEAEIQPRGQAQFDTKFIDLKMTANEIPNVVVEPEDFLLGLNLVTCKKKVLWWDLALDCGIARWLLSARGFQTKYPLTLRNKGFDDVQINDTDLIVMEEQGSKRWTERQLRVLDRQKELLAHQTETMWLEFERDAMTPGHYTGYISMTMEGAPEPLKVPIDIRVRTGPFWAILALFVGAGFGLLGLFGEGNTTSGQGGGKPQENGKEGEEGTPTPDRSLGVLGGGGRSSESNSPSKKRKGWKIWTRIVIVKVVAYIGAVLVGLAVVYAGEQGTTFGANGLIDILAIGAWGFAADLGSRGLNRYLGT